MYLGLEYEFTVPSWLEVHHLSQPFKKIFYLLSNLYTQRGSQTHDLKIKSSVLHWRSQPGTPSPTFFSLLEIVFLCYIFQ